jgi:hypothetical protein
MTVRLRLLAAAAALVASLTAASTASAGHGVTVHCHGSSTLCHAVVNLAGGASNEHVRIVLPGHHWTHPTARPSASDLVGAYSLTGGHFRGAEYFVTLSAVRSITSGYLVFTFRRG